MSGSESYEVLGKFYLGREYDLNARTLGETNVLYDSKDMVTHAMCVGMTGSGKTGLCLALLEEAAIDKIPAICIDPKGDLGNLLLTFPNLDPTDFKDWIDPGEVTRKGIPLDELAKQTADTWRSGLEKWDQNASRIQKFRDSVDISIYTPGSNIGLPLTVLKSFDVPPASTLEDAETFREKVSSSASGLLTLLGIDADPLTSREHILLSKIFEQAWKANQNLDLGELIRRIQSPPIDKIGVIDLERFFPAQERVKLAMSLNNLLASPAFAGWLEGESLDIKKLLYTSEGNPRLSIISIAHLNDTERMFFVTILLGELLSWMRAQPGTSSLRAMFYMDEVYGYFPPSAKPPSKPPMLTLLKQARAFGLGIMLATQNPMDLDYKGLSNMGTWFLGRLQTQRDKDRVLDGLEGAAAQSGAGFDRADMERQLSALGARVFLMNNVHANKPQIFQSRWALSFLRGPLSKEHIQKLMKPKRAAMASAVRTGSNSAGGSNVAVDPSSGSGAIRTSVAPVAGSRPIIPADVTERFLVPTKKVRDNYSLKYRPAILSQSTLHYVKATNNVDYWEDVTLMQPIVGPPAESIWDQSFEIPKDTLQLFSSPEDGYQYDDLPSPYSSAKNFAKWDKELKEYLFRNRQVTIYSSKVLKRTSLPGQSESDARIELNQAIREARDAATEKIKEKYEDKIRLLQPKILAAQQKLDKEKDEEKSQWWSSALDVATSVLSVVLDNRSRSRSKATQAAKAAKGLSKATSARSDAARADEVLQGLLDAKLALEVECQDDIDSITSEYSVENIKLDTIDIPMRKADTRIKLLGIAWVPWQVGPTGIASPLVELPDGYVQSA